MDSSAQVFVHPADKPGCWHRSAENRTGMYSRT
jgi:hypothetical protein